MKTLFIIPLVLMSLVSFPSWGLTKGELVKVDEGRWRGTFKNGKEEGYWTEYWDNGQLLTKGNYKNGNQDGYWELLNRDGSVNKHFTGTYKNDVKVSD